MARKSEVDKIIDLNAHTFDKYVEYSDWEKKHLKCENPKYKTAFDKYHKPTDAVSDEAVNDE